MTDTVFLLRPGVHVAAVPGRGVFFGGDTRKFILDIPQDVVDVFRRHEPALLEGVTETQLARQATASGDHPETVLGMVRAMVGQTLVRQVSPLVASKHRELSAFRQQFPGIAAELGARHQEPEQATIWLRDQASAQIAIRPDSLDAGTARRVLEDCGIPSQRIAEVPLSKPLATSRSLASVTIFAPDEAPSGSGTADLTTGPAAVHGWRGHSANHDVAEIARSRYWTTNSTADDITPLNAHLTEPVQRAAIGLAAVAAVRAAAGLEKTSLCLVQQFPLQLARVSLDTPVGDAVDQLVRTFAAAPTGPNSQDRTLRPVRLVDGADLPQLPHHTAAARALDAGGPAAVGIGGEPTAAAIDALLAAHRQHAEHSAGVPAGHGYAGRTRAHATVDAYLRMLRAGETALAHYSDHDLPTRRLWLDYEYRTGTEPDIRLGKVTERWWTAEMVDPRDLGRMTTAYGRTRTEATYCLLAAARLRAILAGRTPSYKVPDCQTAAVSALSTDEAEAEATALARIPDLAGTTLFAAAPDPLYGPHPIHCGTVR